MSDIVVDIIFLDQNQEGLSLHFLAVEQVGLKDLEIDITTMGCIRLPPVPGSIFSCAYSSCMTLETINGIKILPAHGLEIELRHILLQEGKAINRNLAKWDDHAFLLELIKLTPIEQESPWEVDFPRSSVMDLEEHIDNARHPRILLDKCKLCMPSEEDYSC